MHPKVTTYLDRLDRWQPELRLLRDLVVATGLTETFKWSHPCYTYGKANILLLHAFRDYCAILFFKGALLQDADQRLVQQTDKVRSARQLRFTGVRAIERQRATVRGLVYEAIEVERSGVSLPPRAQEECTVPEELSAKFREDTAFRDAFEALTPGRQRGYLLYFSEAKQAATRRARIEKQLPRILSGFGRNDCTCGLSKRMPNCDGAHRKLGKLA